jgi:ROK family
VNALDPALIVVGGGLGLATSYREAAVRAMLGAVELPTARELPVVPAQLGKVGGALGAALAGAVP